MLAVFSVVFVCDFLCDLGIIKNAMAHAGLPHDHEAVVTHNHHDDHGHSHEFEPTPHKVPNQENDTEDEDCCEEETSQFYASLVKHELPVFDLDKIVVTLELPWSPTYNTHYTYKETNPHILNNALSPPIAGLYARILFQSFLC